MVVEQIKEEGEVEEEVQLTYGQLSMIVLAVCWLQVVQEGPVDTALVVLVVVSSVRQVAMDMVATVVVADLRLPAGRI